jgi:hypothetical protein
MISRAEAFEVLHKYLRDDKLVKHSLAVEAILRAAALKLNEDEEVWGLTGLLHDLDYEYTKDDPSKHAVMSAQILEDLLPGVGVDAIKAHNYMHTDQVPTTSLDKALIAADAVSGLIIASALVMPTRQLATVRPETVFNKFKDKSFAAGCNRKRIELCMDIGLDLEVFLALSLKALQTIADELGL